MAITKLPTTVEYEDGQTEDVVTDQRDHIAAELHFKDGFPNLLEAKTFQAFHFITWHALKRLGRTTQTYQTWGEKVVGVEPSGEADPLSGGSQAASDET